MDRCAILFVDDEPEIRDIASGYFSAQGYDITLAGDGLEALELMRTRRFQVVFTDLMMPGMDGLSLLKAVKNKWPDTPVVMLTGYASIESAIEATKLGCYDYLQKPIRLEQMKSLVDRLMEENRRLEREGGLQRSEGEGGISFAGIMGRSPKMKEIYALISKISSSGPTVLIQGESGTGKELIARGVWKTSPRREMPFVPVNCGAIPEGLAESELFGHVQGAFTGSVRDAKGLFEAAHGGTVFLDEITEISPALQVKLLRVLQEKRIRRVGDHKEIEVDVRIIAATNRDPAASMREGRFREDLFYRLNVVPIYLPPLRERREDIDLLIEHFLQRSADIHGQRRVLVRPDAMEALRRYRWPGNVRELENVIERACLLGSGRIIGIHDLPRDLCRSQERGGTGQAAELNLKVNEPALIKQALAQADGNKGAAAELLGINLSTLYRKMRKYGFPIKF